MRQCFTRWILSSEISCPSTAGAASNRAGLPGIPGQARRSSVTARAAELEEQSSPRPATGFGGRAGDLEEALGTVIAARVREFRLQLGWTVGQLAAESGISKGMLSKIENAQAAPSLATLARLSEALQVPVTAFFRGLNEEQD